MIVTIYLWAETLRAYIAAVGVAYIITPIVARDYALRAFWLLQVPMPPAGTQDASHHGDGMRDARINTDERARQRLIMISYNNTACRESGRLSLPRAMTIEEASKLAMISADCCVEVSLAKLPPSRGEDIHDGMEVPDCNYSPVVYHRRTDSRAYNHQQRTTVSTTWALSAGIAKR